MEVTACGIINTIVFILLCYVIHHIWEKRLLYYTSKIPGPSSIPFVGSFFLITGSRKNFLQSVNEACKSQPSIFKGFIGDFFFIFISEPESLDILLNTFLEKSTPFYECMNEFFTNSLLVAPADIWKNHRRIINQSFNTKTVLSFHNIFVENSKQLVSNLHDHCNKEIDLFSIIWQNNLGAAFECLTKVSTHFIGAFSNSWDTRTYLCYDRLEDMFSLRLKKFWLFFDFFYKQSNLRKEAAALKEKLDVYGKKILELKMQKLANDRNNDEIKSKLFLPNMINTNESNHEFEEKYLVNEILFMLTAASETLATEINFVVLMLGLHPEIQNKIYEEVISIQQNEDFSFEDTKKMNYTERVFKETTRLFPAAPLIARSVDKDFKLGPYVLPSGSHITIPIMHIHRRPDLWRDPLKFDPDRFLPEEAAKRPRNAFLPFSLGSRNCIGHQYAKLFSKLMIAYIVRNFTIKAVNYNCVEDIECEVYVIMKSRGCHVILEKRDQL